MTVPFELVSQGDEASFSFTVVFDPSRLTNPVVTLGTGVPAGSNLSTNLNEAAAGRIGILVDATNTYAAGTRQILRIRFDVQPNQTFTTPVTLGSVPTPQSVSNAVGALLPTNYVAGTVQIIFTTAAGVEVSGRVTTADGRGVRNAVVSMVGSDGIRRLATTGSFGYYRFDDIEAGETYVVSVASKRYRYAPRLLQVFDTLTDIDFVGQE